MAVACTRVEVRRAILILLLIILIRRAVLVVGGRDRAPIIVIRAANVLVVCVIIIVNAEGVTLRHSFTMHLVFFFFAHAMYLFFKKLHLVSIAVPYFVFFPLFVFPALLHSFFVQVKATQVLNML